MRAILQKLTVEQWRAIDAEYLDRPLPDARVMWVVLTAVVCLVLPIYLGSPRFIHAQPWARQWFSGLPDAHLGPRLYWVAFKAINYVLVPVLCIKWVLRDAVVDYGLRLHPERKVWMLYGGLVVLALPIVFAASQAPSFLATYPRYPHAADTWSRLVLWEAAYGAQFVALEFFFRGFLLFALARSLGSAAIFVAVLPYTMIHFSKPLAETLGSMVAGVVLGTLALRTRSIYGGVLVHCSVAWAMDGLALLHGGELARLWAGG